MRTHAHTIVGQSTGSVTTTAPPRARCVCGWWKDDDGRCVNRLCGEFGQTVEDDNQENE